MAFNGHGAIDECSLELITGWLQRLGWRPGQEKSTTEGGGLMQVDCEGEKSEDWCHRSSARMIRARIDVANRA